ncbi:hypothetical protein [Haliea sp.]|uniref:hypothetical protein n=1 Tax=Haliea sp. TaxID=1932666 RepID=UPI0025C10601|nr:hypothetical protein [Haliea sp.]
MSNPLWIASIARCGAYLLLSGVILSCLLVWQSPGAGEGKLEPLSSFGSALPGERPVGDTTGDVVPDAASVAHPFSIFHYVLHTVPLAEAAVRLHVTRYPLIPQGPPGLV